MRFVQHVPSFVDHVDPTRAEIADLESLLKLPCVAQWTKGMDGHKFSHWARSDECLMAVYGDNTAWWVVGYVTEIEKLGLPVWNPPKEKT